MKKWCAAFVMFLAMTMLGCSLVPFIGPIISIGVMWAEGEAKKYYQNEKPVIERAVRSVIHEVGYTILEDEQRGETTFLKVGGGEDCTFKIKIIPERHNVTKLAIRIDIMGNKPYAEMIFREVDKQPDVRCFQTVEQLKTALEE